MKTCSRCDRDLDESEFGVNNARPDGLMIMCRPCAREYSRAWRAGTIEPWVRKTQLPGYATRKKKEWMKDHPEAAAKAQRRKDERRRWKMMARRGLATMIYLTPDEVLRRRRARKTFGRYLERGKIIRQPCFCCGSTTEVHGHHVDYDRPLDVVWLCKTHHREAHMIAESA